MLGWTHYGSGKIESKYDKNDVENLNGKKR